jgi:hypothetical protein
MVGQDEIDAELGRFDGRRVETLRLLVSRGLSPDGIAALIEAVPGAA